SPFESGWNGRVAVAVSRWHKRAIARARRVGTLFGQWINRLDQTWTTGHARDRKERSKAISAGEASDRYSDRDRLLSARRDSAVRAAAIAGEVSCRASL